MYNADAQLSIFSGSGGEVPYKSTTLNYIYPGGNNKFNADTSMISSANTKSPYGYYNAEKLSVVVF